MCRVPVPDHDPTPRRVVVERGQRVFDRGDCNTGRGGKITEVSRLRRNEQQRFEQCRKLLVIHADQRRELRLAGIATDSRAASGLTIGSIWS